jgi:ribosome-binding protein aMBF1 (putative translation factor)
MLEYRDRNRSGRDAYAKVTDQAWFVQAIADTGQSNRSLASRVSCHHSMISHLRSGRKRTCTVALASSLEEALGFQPGSLFSAHGV